MSCVILTGLLLIMSVPTSGPHFFELLCPDIIKRHSEPITANWYGIDLILIKFLI